MYLEPELNVALIRRSGEALEWWTDFERTAQSFGRFSSKDEATLRRWRNNFLPIVEHILVPESQSPPIAPERRTRLLRNSPEGRLLLEISALSPLEFVQREFEHPLIQGALCCSSTACAKWTSGAAVLATTSPRYWPARAKSANVYRGFWRL